MKAELDVVETAARLLKWRGDVQIGYLTANFEPYSSQQRPDLSFVPARGQNAGLIFFVELRFFVGQRMSPHYPLALREHRAFAAEAASGEFAGFAFATNQQVERTVRQQLIEDEIIVFEGVTTGEELAQLVIAWACGGGGDSAGFRGRIKAD